MFFKNQFYIARLNHLQIIYCSASTGRKTGINQQCAMTTKMIYKTTRVFAILSIFLSSFQIQLSNAVEVLCSKHEFNMALVHLKTCSIQGKKLYKIPKCVYKKSSWSLEWFFRTVHQNNFLNKILLFCNSCSFCEGQFSEANFFARYIRTIF